MRFFLHPLIDIIAQHQVMNDSSLLCESGMDKKRFKTEFKKLINEGHILIGDHDRIYPRYLTLIVRDKATQLFYKEIPLKYIPARELKKLTGYDEMDEEYIEGMELGIKHIGLFEADNDLKMNFDRYSYCLMVGYANMAYEEPVLKRKFTIVHLDDHEIFGRGMEIGVKDKFFPDSEWKHFLHPDDTLAYIEDKFARNDSVNFIITDIMHPGLNGYEFAQAIRTLELEYNMFRIPIIVVSMRKEENPLFHVGLSENLFDRYFPKSIECDIMGNYIKGIMMPSWVS